MTHHVIQPDLFDPLHDVLDGGEGGAAAGSHVLVAAVRIYEAGQTGPDLSEQEDWARRAFYELHGDRLAAELEGTTCPEDEVTAVTPEAPASETSFQRQAKAGRSLKSKATSVARKAAR